MIWKLGKIGAALLIALLCGSPVSADIKRIPYPEVKVDIAVPFERDAAFETMRKAFIEAATRKDAAALFSLVGPSFIWTKAGVLSEELDPGRDALHNFKVLFGFRPSGENADGPVEGGPYWDTLVQFANDLVHYRTGEDTNLVCGPLLAEIRDGDVFDQAATKIAAEDAEWVFAISEATITRSATDATPVAKFKGVAVPVLNTLPPALPGQTVTRTHYEVLLASGRSGWIAASAVLPLVSARLCYSQAAGGEWKISLYDDTE